MMILNQKVSIGAVLELAVMKNYTMIPLMIKN
nr:MAG TPA: hypothetical protein [Caudoviricetes sp.]